MPPFLQSQWAQVVAAVPSWRAAVPLLRDAASRHGDAQRWFGALASMPALPSAAGEFGACVRTGRSADCTPEQQRQLRDALLALRPWRKGPFELYGVTVDAEWRCGLKWQRIARHLGDLDGELVLDVGAGNGYYGWRMRAAGAALVVGVDPGILFLIQHLAVCRYMQEADVLGNCLLPLRLEDLPPAPAEFDTVFSMGVLYHRRDPVGHLRSLCRLVRPGGRLVLETLIITDSADSVLEPAERYARMRNVWAIPSPNALTGWLARAGFEHTSMLEVTRTTPMEQRRTDWMPFESLSDALDPHDPSRTVEGYPAPQRALLIAHR
jgi:tRNA (mo5U34)-methyltransferase